MRIQSFSGVPVFPIPDQEILPMDSKDHCLASLELVQNARSHILHSLKNVILKMSQSELERIFEEVEIFRNLSDFCLERYRYMPEAGSSHDNELHQRRCKEQSRLNFLESKIIEIAREKGLIQPNIVKSLEFPITKAVAAFFRTHYLIPLGILASCGASTGLISLENPLGPMAPAGIGILTTIITNRESVLSDSANLGKLFIKEIAENALPLSFGMSAIACYHDHDNFYQTPYLLGLASAIQIGSCFFRTQDKDIQSQPLKKNLAKSVINLTHIYFQNGYKWGAIAGVASAALSYYFDQSTFTNTLFGVGVYAIHAGVSGLMNHAERRIPT